MPDKKLVFEFFHNGFAGLRPTAPVDVPHRIASPIFAQRYELIALSDVRRHCHATLLIFQSAGQRDGAERVTLWQNQN